MKKILYLIPLLLMLISCETTNSPSPRPTTTTTQQPPTPTNPSPPTPPVNNCTNCGKVVRNIKEYTTICPDKDIPRHICNYPGSRPCKRVRVFYVSMEIMCGDRWSRIKGEYNSDSLYRYNLGDTYCHNKPVSWF